MRLVAAATRTTQNTDDAEAWACAGAAVLEALIVRGCTMAAAVADAVEELRSGSGRVTRYNVHCSPGMLQAMYVTASRTYRACPSCLRARVD